MSAPSVLHEDRVAALADLATLAGYTQDAVLHPGQRPDVVRLHRARPSLLIGDGKATETPTDTSTQLRLLAYGTAARVWLEAGFDVRLLVCHGPDPTRQWLGCLAQVSQGAGLLAVAPNTRMIDEGTSVSGVVLRSRRPPGPRPAA